jgi:HTH-type transcriptional regulator/antitoxin HigA
MATSNTILKIITPQQYEIALKRLEEIFEADISTPEGIEAQQLTELIIEYEEKEWPITFDLADKYFYDDYY